MSAVETFLDALGTPPVDALGGLRQQARERFVGSGFPTRRNETWKFTELRPLIETRFALSAEAEPGVLPELAQSDRLVFVNGRFSAAQSHVGELPDGVVLGSFADWARRNPGAATSVFDLEGGAERAFLSLNAAFVSDGLVLIVPDGVQLV